MQAGSNYTLDSVNSASLNLNDNDSTSATAGILIQPLTGTTQETGETAGFQISLKTKPNYNVTIKFTSSDTTEGTIVNPSLTFTPSNWNQPQTLTVKGVDDDYHDQDKPYTITGEIGTAGTQDLVYRTITIPRINLTNLDPDTDDKFNTNNDGDDTRYFGDGKDYAVGGSGRDELFGEDAEDTLYGGYDNDRLWGGNGNDKLYGEQDEDELFGEAGNDTLQGGIGADSMTGGSGNDLYYFEDPNDVIADQGLATDVDAVYVVGAFSYKLGDGIDNGTLQGNANTNLIGNISNNNLIGNTGDNVINGSTGNDILTGGTGSDTLIGGEGIDKIIFGQSNNKINLNLTTAQNTGEGTDVIKYLENVDGGAGNDTITGSSANNILLGSSGIDTVIFGSGNNTINLNTTTIQDTGEGKDVITGVENIDAGAGNDLITGTTGNNSLSGSAGNDTLKGGAGTDNLTGGAGLDKIVCNFGQSLTTGIDRLSDFKVGEDRLDILTKTGGNVSIKTHSNGGNRTSTTASDLMKQVFTDTNLTTTGNQALGVNSSVFVTWNNNSYLIVNDASAGFQANSDLILNVTGFSGNFQTATVDTLFI